MDDNKFKKACTCGITASVDLVGGKWKTTILLHLRDRTLRFGELKRVVAVSQKVLSQQLKELEKDGIVTRRVYAEVPPRVEYSLSTYGQTLQPVLDALYAWGNTHCQLSQQADASNAAQVTAPELERLVK